MLCCSGEECGRRRVNTPPLAYPARLSLDRENPPLPPQGLEGMELNWSAYVCVLCLDVREQRERGFNLSSYRREEGLNLSL